MEEVNVAKEREEEESMERTYIKTHGNQEGDEILDKDFFEN